MPLARICPLSMLTKWRAQESDLRMLWALFSGRKNFNDILHQFIPFQPFFFLKTDRKKATKFQAKLRSASKAMLFFFTDLLGGDVGDF